MTSYGSMFFLTSALKSLNGKIQTKQEVLLSCIFTFDHNWTCVHRVFSKSQTRCAETRLALSFRSVHTRAQRKEASMSLVQLCGTGLS